MTTHRISASAVIAASPEVLYEIIADYHEGHQRIIPKPPFVSLVVEQGGRGAGTVVRVQIRVLGLLQTYRAKITEPEPGRVLVEASDTGYTTSFTVQPRADGQHAEVTIATELPRRPLGIRVVERWLMSSILEPMFVEELKLLADEASARVAESLAAEQRSSSAQLRLAAPAARA